MANSRQDGCAYILVYGVIIVGAICFGIYRFFATPGGWGF